MKYVLALLIAMFALSSPVLAEEAAEESVVTVTEESVEAATDWLEVGNQYGQMVAGFISGTARELGVAVNEFAMSPVGLLSVALVVYHFAGDAILGFVTSGVWFITTLSLWLFLFFKIGLPIVRYEDTKFVKWGKERTVSKPIRELTKREGVQFILVFFMIFILIVGLILL